MHPSSKHGNVVIPVNCTFNGVASNGVLGGTLTNVSPGESVEVVCLGSLLPDSEVAIGEESPLVQTSGVPTNETDGAAIEVGTTDDTGSIDGVFTIPSPFVAPDPNAVCPPTAAQVVWATASWPSRTVWTSPPSTCNMGSRPRLRCQRRQQLQRPTTSEWPRHPTVTATGWRIRPERCTRMAMLRTSAQWRDRRSNAPISHIVATPDGLGYWPVAADGGTFAFGDAHSTARWGDNTYNAPVVDLAPTLDGGGYWLVASDGGIFAFGDAAFRGSMGGQHLNQPVVGMAADSATGGYWEVVTDGGIFSFGAPFFGSTGAIHLNKPVNGMAATPNGEGYWFVASDGGIFSGGNAPFHGSMGRTALDAPVVGMAPDNATGGYWLVASDGGIFSFDAPFFGAA